MTAPVLDQVRQIVADVLNVPLNSVSETSSSENLENWDSLQHLNLVLALEQSSGLEFSPEEIEQMGGKLSKVTKCYCEKMAPVIAEKLEVTQPCDSVLVHRRAQVVGIEDDSLGRDDNGGLRAGYLEAHGAVGART